MEILGSIARIDTGGAYGRRPAAAAVAAPSQASGSGGGRGQQGGASIAKPSSDQAAAHAEAAAPPRETAEAPPAVQIDGLYEKRITGGRNGLTIDLVYKNTGLRVARLVGRSATADEGEQAVPAGTAARAYQAALGGGLAASTERTG